VHGVRITLDRGGPATELRIAHVDLYFFFDLDVVIPVVEICGNDLDLATAQDILFRFGRAYPPYWEADGRGAHCPWLVEWLGADGEVLSTSDYQQRAKYLEFVCEHRTPGIAAHWEWLLAPLAQHHASEPGTVRYQQLEYHRMPTMAYLALDDVDVLTRADWVRLGLVTGPGDPQLLPYSHRHLADTPEPDSPARPWIRPASRLRSTPRRISVSRIRTFRSVIASTVTASPPSPARPRCAGPGRRAARRRGS